MDYADDPGEIKEIKHFTPMEYQLKINSIGQAGHALITLTQIFGITLIAQINVANLWKG